MLKACYRLKKNKDFRTVFKTGKSSPSRFLVIYVRKNNLKKTRIGFSVSKKVGGAVTRNRVKRVLRELVRKHINEILPGNDIVFIARVAIKGIKSSSIENNLVKLLEKHELVRK